MSLPLALIFAILWPHYENSIDLRTKRNCVYYLLGFLFYRDEFMRKALRQLTVYSKSVF